jgi:hypothetical protein
VGRFDFCGGFLDHHRKGGVSQAHLPISLVCRLLTPKFAKEYFAPG